MDAISEWVTSSNLFPNPPALIYIECSAVEEVGNDLKSRVIDGRNVRVL